MLLELARELSRIAVAAGLPVNGAAGGGRVAFVFLR